MDTRERLAELAVVVGANVQPGQVVRPSADVEHGELVRSVADAKSE
jgi:leucyl aminopeptidase (aminopeptidase T)